MHMPRWGVGVRVVVSRLHPRQSSPMGLRMSTRQGGCVCVYMSCYVYEQMLHCCLIDTHLSHFHISVYTQYSLCLCSTRLDCAPTIDDVVITPTPSDYTVNVDQTNDIILTLADGITETIGDHVTRHRCIIYFMFLVD